MTTQTTTAQQSESSTTPQSVSFPSTAKDRCNASHTLLVGHTEITLHCYGNQEHRGNHWQYVKDCMVIWKRTSK